MLPTFTREITREQYLAHKDMNPMDAANDMLSMALLYGYGVYGFRLYEEDGKYYMWVEHGSTCD
jgi:hypothetical protein